MPYTPTYNNNPYNNNNNNNQYQQYQNKNPLNLFLNPLYNYKQFSNLYQFFTLPANTTLLHKTKLTLTFFIFNNHNSTIHTYNNQTTFTITSNTQLSSLNTYLQTLTNQFQSPQNQQLITIFYLIYNPQHQLTHTFYKHINKSISSYTPNFQNQQSQQPNTTLNNFTNYLNTINPSNTS